jgi:hypothetical protein
MTFFLYVLSLLGTILLSYRAGVQDERERWIEGTRFDRD